jgi:signal transduction histidine kinase
MIGTRLRRLRIPSSFRPRWTVRLRLTLLYGGLFVVGGAVLLGITFALVAPGNPTVISTKGGPAEAFALSPGTTAPSYGAPIAPSGPSGLVPPPGAVVGPVPASSVPSPHAKAQLEGLLKAQADHERSAQLHKLLTESGVALGLMAVVSVLLGWIIAGRVLRPLRTMTATARRLSEDNLGDRIALRGPDDELTELADTFDDLLHRLDTAFEAQRRFVANASHELRTPLTLERTVVEVALSDPAADVESLRAMGRQVLRTNAEHARLIDALLVLARSQRGLGQTEAVNMATVTLDAIELVTPVMTSNDIRVDRSLDPASVTGDRALLERLVTNLVDNAARHNHGGGWVEVRTGVHAGDATVEVSNSGPRIARDQVGSLFEPFRRLGADRAGSPQGTGLGLSIVDAIVTAHHGAIEARAREGGGLDVRVAFRERRAPRSSPVPIPVTDPVPVV